MNLKSYIKNKISILKSWIKEYFLLKNSLEHLEYFIKMYYVHSIGFDDIYYGNKNMKRFIICIANLAIGWLTVGYLLSFVLSDEMFSMINIPPISSENLKLLCLLGTLLFFLIGFVRTDQFLGKINCNLSPFKVIYYLMKDLKQLHKLNENYKKLAILSRSIQILFLDCGTILLVIAGTLYMMKMAILSGKIYWFWGIPIYILIFITFVTTGIAITCVYIIFIAYYAMIFDQINHQINLISNEKLKFFKKRKLIINKTKQR